PPPRPLAAPGPRHEALLRPATPGPSPRRSAEQRGRASGGARYTMFRDAASGGSHRRRRRSAERNQKRRKLVDTGPDRVLRLRFTSTQRRSAPSGPCAAPRVAIGTFERFVVENRLPQLLAFEHDPRELSSEELLHRAFPGLLGLRPRHCLLRVVAED